MLRVTLNSEVDLSLFHFFFNDPPKESGEVVVGGGDTVPWRLFISLFFKEFASSIGWDEISQKL